MSNGIFSRAMFYSYSLLSILNTSFHVPSMFFHVEVMWNVPERSLFSGAAAVVFIMVTSKNLV